MTLGKHYFTNNSKNAVLIKGAIIDRYAIKNKMSQGEIVFLNEKKYIGENSGKRAEHYKRIRIVMQGITGVNEKVRLKMTIVDNMFCANSVNYLIFADKSIGSEYLYLGILNAKLLNFIFKKFSTNSNVNGYEVDNLPIPPITSGNRSIAANIEKLVDKILSAKKQTTASDTLELERQIDELVYELYELTPDEIAIIAGK